MGGQSRDVDPDDEESSDEGAPSGPVTRDTVKPSFNLAHYAADMVGREHLPTITDEARTEEARIASVLMDSTPPFVAGERGSSPEIEIAVRYSEVDELKPDAKLAFLRARLAPTSRIPSLVRKITELGPVIEDPKTAYVLGFVDGLLPLETIVEVAGLPEVEALQILDRAADQHLIVFGKSADPPRRR
jgi:hypothetical protein